MNDGYKTAKIRWMIQGEYCRDNWCLVTGETDLRPTLALSKLPIIQFRREKFSQKLSNC
jgi:hypothetical protein